jgi:hypothetical protein
MFVGPVVEALASPKVAPQPLCNKTDTASPCKTRSGEASPDGIVDLLASAAMADVATSNEVEMDPDDFMMMADAPVEHDASAAVSVCRCGWASKGCHCSW